MSLQENAITIKGINSTLVFLYLIFDTNFSDKHKNITATLENDATAIENISRKLTIVNSQIDILAEKLGLDKNNAEDIKRIQLLCTPLIDYLESNPVGNINGEEYDLKYDLKYLTCNTKPDYKL